MTDVMDAPADRYTEPGETGSGGSPNCLVDKLSHYVDLHPSEYDALNTLQTDLRHFARDELLFSTADHHQDLYIVQEGWLFNYIDMPDGRRQIVNIYHPGDVIGFPDVALRERSTNLYAVERGSICPFPKEGLQPIFKHCPRLAALLLTIALREQTILIDRLRIFSRMSAQARVGYLFLELEARLKIGQPDGPDGLYMPLNQQEIGDAVGLTNVSVSRAISALEKAGMLEARSKRIDFHNRDALIELCDFKDRYAEMQTDWFPADSAA